jgi:hypothetical protein
VPEDLSPHPDSKRYPNHVFTGSQPSNGDERVTHIYEILPSPWVPFTRYDDDLGPIQGRRRAVKNEGQQADLTSSTKISYEGREGSAIVSNEIEESWSIKVDEDGNSLFPLKDRDFYDASRGAVQERRQLFVPTGEEEGTLENVNGVITQTSYEPYNEFLSVKIVQTYKVDGPQLIGRATDNDGQLVTVTTQRKGALNYIPPNPTATRTVEVNREDAESLVERIVDTPEVFTAKTFSLERPDPIPQKFRVAVPLQSNQEVVAGEAQLPTLSEGEISRTEEQRNKFIKRTTATSRDQTVLPKTLTQRATDQDRQGVIITETLQLGDTDEAPSATQTIESEALGDGNFIVRKIQAPVFSAETYRKTKEDLTPQKFRAAQEDLIFEENIAGTVDPNFVLGEGEFAKSEQQVNKFVKRISTTSRKITKAVTLNEKILTSEGQIGSRVLTLALGDQEFDQEALGAGRLIDASVEALGDNRTIKTETKVPSVFSGKLFSSERPDNVPQKFKAKLPVLTIQESVAGTAQSQSLIAGQFSKSEQQVTEFVKRVSTTARSISEKQILTGLQYTSELGGGIAVITETYPFDGPDPVIPELGVLSDEIENLGDETRIRRQIKLIPQNYDVDFFDDEGKPVYVQSLQPLVGQEYDEELDIIIPYQQVVAKPATSITTGQRKRVSPRDISHSVVQKYDVQDVQQSLDGYYWEVPDMIDIRLPNILKRVIFLPSNSGSFSEASGFGDTYSWSTSATSSSAGSIAYDIEEGFNGTIPTIRAIFFLPKGEASPDAVLNKVRLNKQNPNINFWPNVKAESHLITITERSSSGSKSVSISFDSGSNSSSRGGSFSKESITIPPTIHKQLLISSDVSFGNNGDAGAVSVTPNTLEATKYETFPTGLFLYRINASPYKFSYVRVDALLVDIKNEYV